MFISASKKALSSLTGGTLSMDLMQNASRLLGSAAAAIVLTACVADPEPTPESSSSVAIESSSSVAISSSSEVNVSSSEAISSEASSSQAQSSSVIVTPSSSSVASSEPESSSSESSSVESSSSEAPSSSSVASSSSTPANLGDFSGEPNLTTGKNLYGTELCSVCHGPTGEGAAGGGPINLNKPALSTFEGLAQLIHATMPSEGKCEDSCARDIAAFIRNGYTDQTGGSSSSASGGGGDIVDESTRAERVGKGQTTMNSALCVGCHTNHDDFIECNNCGSWTELRDYIANEMPQQQSQSNNGPDALSPSDCEMECADRAADYIWNQINGWALTTENGEDNGIKTIVEDRTGQDTKRLKSYDMLMDDFTRIFGTAPSVLAGSKPAFKPEPDFWHTEGEIGAVALNVIVNAAIQGCESESLPAINEAALRTSCGDWANRMWLRDATEAELQSCMDVALIDTTELNDQTRATYACVSMMTSLPALSF